MKNIFRVLSIIIALILNIAPYNAFASQQNVKTITIMPYQRQQIKGWGFFPNRNNGGNYETSRGSNIAPRSVTDKAVMGKLINDYGITMFRQDLMVQCGNEDGSINTDWMDKLTDALKVMIDGGINEYMLTAWGVPAGMSEKDSAGYNSIREDREDNYCKFVVNAFKYITDKGFPAPVGFSLQNEPQDGRRWARITAEQYARITKKMRKALDENGFEDVMLLGPENAGYFQYFTQMGTDYSKLYEDPEFAKSMGALITHAYYFNGSGSKASDAYRFDMAASNFPHMERWETEFSGGLSSGEGYISQNLRSAIFTAQILIGDIAWSGMNRWFYWYGFDNRQYIYPDGSIKFMDTGKSGEHQSLNYGDGISWAKKNLIGVALSTIWKNVPVGSVVHRVWTDDETLLNDYNLKGDLVAFERADGTYVLVIVNESNEEKTYNINSIYGNSARIYTINDETDQHAKVTYRNIENGRINDFKAEPWSIKIIVTDQKDVSAPRITVDSDNSIYEEKGVYKVIENNVTITGETDEDTEIFKINGSDVKLDGRHFTYSFDASKTTTLNFYAKDKSGNETNEKRIFELKRDLLILTLENAISSTNDNAYVLRGHTNREAVVTAGEKSVKTNPNNEFEIDLSLAEGNNTINIMAESGKIKRTESFDIFCDSVKPEITLAEIPERVNDFEFLFKGSINEGVSELKIDDESILVHSDNTFEAKVLLSEGNNEFAFTAVDKFGNTSEKRASVKYIKDENSPHFVNGIAYARKVNEPITIDGRLNEKAWKTDLKISRQVLGSYPANNIVNFSVMWDEKYFYIGAEVEDGKLFWDNAAPYLNDSIEFLLNPSNEKAGSFTEDDRQVFTGPINGDLNTLYTNKSINIEQAYSIKDGKFSAEIAVPWSEMNKTAKEGEKIGFEIVYNDDDLGGNNRDSIQTWTSEVQDYYTFTTSFGTVELVGADVYRYEDIAFEKKAVEIKGADTIERDGRTLYELNTVLEKYGAVYYDNPNTGLVNVFTSPTRKTDIQENAYTIFVDGNMVTLDFPIVKQDGFYYVDLSFENALFENIAAFEKYPD